MNSFRIAVVFCLTLSAGSAFAADEPAEVAVRRQKESARKSETDARALNLNHCPLKGTGSCGSSFTSSLSTTSCIDPTTNNRGERYTMSLTAGQVIGVEMSSTAFTTFLVVTGPNFFLDFGNTLSYLSTSGRSTQRVDFFVPQTGTYTIEAESLYGPGDVQPSTGPYTLRIICTVTSPTPTCVNANTLCLNSSRFHVTLLARDQRSGQTGVGVALPENDLFGYFSIPALTFNPQLAEVFVKIIDGRPVNGKFWVFYSGLTDLEYTLVVTDSLTGASRQYRKEPGSACGGFDTTAF